MKKTIYAAIVTLTVGIAVGAAVYKQNNQDDYQIDQSSVQDKASSPEKITFKNNGKTVSYDGEEGKTALAMLKTYTDIETEKSDLGEFVTTINGVKANSNKEYWAFYVNGELSSEGAGTYQAKSSDKIEWRLTKL